MTEGNDGSVKTGDNIGAINDGLLNGEIINKSKLGMGPYFFLTSVDKRLDLDGDGEATDPGWIELGRSEGESVGKTVEYTAVKKRYQVFSNQRCFDAWLDMCRRG